MFEPQTISPILLLNNLFLNGAKAAAKDAAPAGSTTSLVSSNSNAIAFIIS